jgi:hypothetical protein
LANADKEKINNFYSPFILIYSNLIFLLIIIFVIIPIGSFSSILIINSKDNHLNLNFRIAESDKIDFQTLATNLGLQVTNDQKLDIEVSNQLAKSITKPILVLLKFGEKKLTWQSKKAISSGENIALLRYLNYLPSDTLFFYQSKNIGNFIRLTINLPKPFSDWFLDLVKDNNSILAIIPSDNDQFELVILSEINQKAEINSHLEKVFSVVESLNDQDKSGQQAKVLVSRPNGNPVYNINLQAQMPSQNNPNLNFMVTTDQNLLIVSSSDQIISKILQPRNSLWQVIEKNNLPTNGVSLAYLNSPEAIFNHSLPLNKITIRPSASKLQSVLESISKLVVVENKSSFEGFVEIK